MSNQFTNPTPPEIYEEALNRDLWKERMESIDELIAKDPQKCVVWPASNPSILQIRDDEGDRFPIHMRRLFWLYKFKTQPSFGPTTCGTKGCVNPSHQRVHVNGGPVAIEPAKAPDVTYAGDTA
ncbi:MAG: hypothetical protein CMP20_04090 [Rickettsiales bacterium]|nr:hypothetical protein [Rickettsiales bacterium]